MEPAGELRPTGPATEIKLCPGHYGHRAGELCPGNRERRAGELRLGARNMFALGSIGPSWAGGGGHRCRPDGVGQSHFGEELCYWAGCSDDTREVSQS